MNHTLWDFTPPARSGRLFTAVFLLLLAVAMPDNILAAVKDTTVSVPRFAVARTRIDDESLSPKFIKLGNYGNYGVHLGTTQAGAANHYGHEEKFVVEDTTLRWLIFEVAPLDGQLEQSNCVINVKKILFSRPLTINYGKSTTGEVVIDTLTSGNNCWQGCSPSVKLYFSNRYYNPNCEVKVTFEIRTGEDMVRHPRFEPGTLADFYTSKDVSITADEDATIYYTQDDEHYLAEIGRTANEDYTSGTQFWLQEPWKPYTGPIHIEQTTRFRALAVKNIDGIPTPSGVDTCLILKRPQEIVAYGHGWYEQDENEQPRTYSWWNYETKAFEQAKITDVATNPWQIAALIKEIYINPDFPAMETTTPDDFRGHIHIGLTEDRSVSSYYFSANAYKSVKASNAETINQQFDEIPTDPNRITDYPYRVGMNPYIKPKKQGYTALLVELKEDYDRTYFKKSIQPKYKHGNAEGNPLQYTEDTPALIAAINECIASVRVLTDGARIDDPARGFGDAEYSPGTLFTTTASLSRFYVVVKGGPDWHALTYYIGVNPFLLFEEISPAWSGDGRLYASLAAGEIYKAEHNCQNALGNNGTLGDQYGHEFVVDLEGERQLDNLTIFVPDYRFRRRDHKLLNKHWWGENGDLTQNYVEGHKPFFAMYATRLQAKSRISRTRPQPVIQDGKSYHYFTATPSWTTNLDNIIASSPTTQEEFRLYTVNPADGTLQRINANGQPCPDTDDPENLIDDLESISYDVLQQDESHTITYRVYARVKGWTGETSWARSNDAEVIIPGVGEAEVLVLDIDVPRKGEFIAAEKRNFYTHWVRLTNVNEDAPFHATKLNSEAATTMSVYRLEPGQDARHGEGVKFADITIQPGVLNTGDNLYHYNYTVTYHEATQTPEANVDASLRTTEGYFTSETPDGVVDFRGFTVVDQFGADIPEDNSHCGLYSYQIVYDYGFQHWSNIASVNIPKTSISATSFLHSLDEVTGDTGRGTDINTRAHATVRALDDVSVVAYRVLDTAGDNAYSDHGIARATRNGDGSYTPQKQDAQGFYHGSRSIPFQADGDDRMMGVTTEDTRTDLTDRGYVPQIRYATRLPDGSVHTSTYGGPEHTISTPRLVFTLCEDPAQGGLPRMRGEAGTNPMPYASTMMLDTEGLDVSGSQKYLYRVWRVQPDGSEKLLNGLHNWGTDPASDRVSNHEVLDADNTDVQVILTDVATDKPIDQLGNYKAQRYIARMYAIGGAAPDEDDPDSPIINSAPAVNKAPRRVQADEYSEFFIDEKELVVEFTDEIITGITGVLNHAEVTRVDYISTTGMRSDKPFPGMNIVVTHYSNGNTVTTKERF